MISKKPVKIISIQMKKVSDNCQTEYIYNCIDENFEKIVEEQIENNL